MIKFDFAIFAISLGISSSTLLYSFLLGDRKEKRIGEKIGIFVFKLLSPLLLGPLKKMKPIHSKIVAKAMIAIAQSDTQQITFESNEISKIIS